MLILKFDYFKTINQSYFYIQTATSDVTRTMNWQSINNESGWSRKWGKSSCLTKLNSRSMTLMQYPVSHSPPFPRSSLLSKKKNSGGGGTTQSLNCLKSGWQLLSGREHKKERKHKTPAVVMWERVGVHLPSCSPPASPLSFFINDTTVHVEMLPEQELKMFISIFYDVWCMMYVVCIYEI